MSIQATLTKVMRRMGAALPALAAGLVTVSVLASSGGAAGALAPPAQGVWACAVNPGRVYAGVRAKASCSGGKEYLNVVPADGVWSCNIPTMWTYDTFKDSRNSGIGAPCQLGSNPGNISRLAKPAEGRWVCALPKNNIWGYNGTGSDTWSTACRLGGGVTQIRLIKPDAGDWSCNVPAGFVSVRSQLVGQANKCLGSFINQLGVQ